MQVFRRGFSGNFQNLISMSSKDTVHHYSALYIRPHEQEMKTIQSFFQPALAADTFGPREARQLHLVAGAALG